MKENSGVLQERSRLEAEVEAIDREFKVKILKDVKDFHSLSLELMNMYLDGRLAGCPICNVPFNKRDIIPRIKATRKRIEEIGMEIARLQEKV